MPDNLKTRNTYLPNPLQRQKLSEQYEDWEQFCDISEPLNAKPDYKMPIDPDPRPPRKLFHVYDDSNNKRFCQKFEEEGALYSSPLCIIL